MTGRNQDRPKSEPIFYSDSGELSMPHVLNFRTHGCPDGAVYIGRPMPRFGLPGSKWANPFKLHRIGATFEERKEAIDQYERHLLDSGLIDDVHELRGRDLVCWCAPSPCHGDVLLRYANRTGD